MKPNKQELTDKQVSSPEDIRQKHIPVLLTEVLNILDPKEGEFFIDGTAGEAGHLKAILEKLGKSGKYLAFDWNAENSKRLEKEFADDKRVRIVNANFADIKDFLNGEKADGLLLDLGFSSGELDSGRGFSFQKDEPLLMTYSDEEEPFYKVLRRLSEKELFEIISLTGERFSRKLAKTIFEAKRKKPIETTGELVDVIKRAVPGNYEHGRINPATRVFLGFRIYANHELENLRKVLNSLNDILHPDGRVGIITFQSLEDKIVKEAFKEMAKEKKIEILTKKPVGPSYEEILKNPRSRSAKIRAAKIIL